MVDRTAGAVVIGYVVITLGILAIIALAGLAAWVARRLW